MSNVIIKQDQHGRYVEGIIEVEIKANIPKDTKRLTEGEALLLLEIQRDKMIEEDKIGIVTAVDLINAGNIKVNGKLDNQEIRNEIQRLAHLYDTKAPIDTLEAQWNLELANELDELDGVSNIDYFSEVITLIKNT